MLNWMWRVDRPTSAAVAASGGPINPPRTPRLDVQRERVSAAVPASPKLDPTRETLLIELRGRNTHAIRLVLVTLAQEADKPEELRNKALMDLCLDLHSALRPGPASVPVIPGRSS
jgi:hypothetical protein